MTTIYTGTADVENGSATVTINTGDPLSAALAAQGFLVALDGAVYFIDGLTDTTTFELTRDYVGTTGTVPVEIWPITQQTGEMAEVFRVVRETRSRLSVFDKNSQGLFFTHLGVTGDADPGPGGLAFDNADPSSVSAVYIDYLDANDIHRSVSPLLALFAPGYSIRVRSLNTAAFYEFAVTGNDDMAGYFRVSLSPIGSSGIIADGEPVSLSWTRSGSGLQWDAAGTLAGRAAYDAEWLNADGLPFSYLASDGDGGDLAGSVLFIKASAASGDWAAGFPITGLQGARGWSPVFGIVSRNGGAEAVFRLNDWTGGQEPKPTAGVGQYVMPGGFTANIENAFNIKGVKGDSQGIRLDMLTGTGTAAMAAGQFRADNAAFGSITRLRFNRAGQDLGTGSITGWLNSLDDVVNAISRGSLRFQATANASLYMEFAITGELTTAANYYELPVAPIAGTRPEGQTTFAAYFVPAGGDGADGDDGEDGTDPGVLFNYSEETGDVDPGAGMLHFDNLDLLSATVLYASKTNRAGTSIAAFLSGLAASNGAVKGRAIVTRQTGNAQTIFNITSVTEDTDFFRLALADNSGSDALVDGSPVSFQFLGNGNDAAINATSLASTINNAEPKASPVAEDTIGGTDSENEGALASFTIGSLASAIQGSIGEVVSFGSNYVAVLEDRGKILNVNVSGSNRAVTLPNASEVGAGWYISLHRNAEDRTNRLRINTVSSQTINGRAAPLDYYDPHATVKLVSDGANWFSEYGVRLRKKVSRYTGSGTHNYDPNCVAAQIDGLGAGAGGASVTTSTGTHGGSAGGGGSGCDATVIIENMTGVASATVTIGAAGAANSDGGDTTYSDGSNSITFGGGKTGGSGSGSGSNASGTGGNVGTLTITGSAKVVYSGGDDGQSGFGMGNSLLAGSSVRGDGGAGGGNRQGQGGKANSTSSSAAGGNSSNGYTGSGYGSGGSAGSACGNGNTGTGGAGRPGLIVITEFIME